MREIRLYGSEGGEAKNLSYPYQKVLSTYGIQLFTNEPKIMLPMVGKTEQRNEMEIQR